MRECGFGSLDGTLFEEFNRRGRYPKGVFPYDFSNFGGETYQTVLERQLELLRELDLEHGYYLLIGHSRNLDTLLHGLGLNERVEQGLFTVVDHATIAAIK